MCVLLARPVSSASEGSVGRRRRGIEEVEVKRILLVHSSILNIGFS